MSALFRGVRDGTPSGKNLCDSCSRCCIMQTDRQKTIYCHDVGSFIPQRVLVCSSYHDKAKPTLHDMEQIAWIWVMDSKKEFTGFKRLTDAQKDGQAHY